MTAARPFRFGASASAVGGGPALAEKARRTEALGYSTLVLPDHLLDQLSPIPALATIAAATERLRIGMYVLNNDLRHPAVLAQELASLDVLSGGRLDIGIGAGWNKPEYDASGIRFDPVGIRIARLEESIAILKGLFADGPFTLAGAHYTITALDGRPKPVQRPHPPFLIGAGGRRLLRIAAREADIVGLAPRIGAREGFASCTIAATAEKIAWVREAAGPRFADIELNTYPAFRPAAVTDEPRKAAAELAARIAAREGTAPDLDELLASPHVFIGSVDELVAKFVSLRERLGISSFMVGPAVEEFAPVVERLAGR